MYTAPRIMGCLTKESDRSITMVRFQPPKDVMRLQAKDGESFAQVVRAAQKRASEPGAEVRQPAPAQQGARVDAPPASGAKTGGNVAAAPRPAGDTAAPSSGGGSSSQPTATVAVAPAGDAVEQAGGRQPAAQQAQQAQPSSSANAQQPSSECSMSLEPPARTGAAGDGLSPAADAPDLAAGLQRANSQPPYGRRRSASLPLIPGSDTGAGGGDATASGADSVPEAPRPPKLRVSVSAAGDSSDGAPRGSSPFGASPSSSAREMGHIVAPARSPDEQLQRAPSGGTLSGGGFGGGGGGPSSARCVACHFVERRP